MKKLKMFLLSLIVLTSINSLHAQTVDEIVNKYIDSAGGKDVISKINSIYMESTVSAMGNDAPATTTILNGKGYKVEMEMNGQKVVSCLTDTGGWMISPMMGTAPQPMPAEQYKMGKLNLDIAWSFIQL